MEEHSSAEVVCMDHGVTVDHDPVAESQIFSPCADAPCSRETWPVGCKRCTLCEECPVHDLCACLANLVVHNMQPWKRGEKKI